MMGQLINDYFINHLSLSMEDALKLRKEYSINYGLAIEGLVLNHKIDPLEYNAKVDDALPLEGVIKPSPELTSLLEDIDRDKVTLWLLTNAYVTHARRVVKLLEVDRFFDGLTFCDYSDMPLVCKPSEAMYRKAMVEAGVDDISRCYFVDDSYQNCEKAQQLGWKTAHLVEAGEQLPPKPASKYQIQSLQELRDVFPDIFKTYSNGVISSEIP